jgi:hypothetical protein
VRHSAMDVSSVHSPGSSRKGPPPVMSVRGAKLPRGRNSTVVPTASPQARPSRHPRKRSLRLAGVDAFLVIIRRRRVYAGLHSRSRWQRLGAERDAHEQRHGHVRGSGHGRVHHPHLGLADLRAASAGAGAGVPAAGDAAVGCTAGRGPARVWGGARLFAVAPRFVLIVSCTALGVASCPAQHSVTTAHATC